MNPKSNNAIEFIKLWMAAKNSDQSIEDIADSLGVTKQAVSFKASRLRSWGVTLPPLKYKVQNPYNVNELNDLIKRLS